MDPASEMEAREWFAEKGMQVVGWYHSHPTFVAIPSIRDIENQMSYQVRHTISISFSLHTLLLVRP
jgi:proteasome lid subunit RPN8/RPN11